MQTALPDISTSQSDVFFFIFLAQTTRSLRLHCGALENPTSLALHHSLIPFQLESAAISVVLLGVIMLLESSSFLYLMPGTLSASPRWMLFWSLA